MKALIMSKPIYGDASAKECLPNVSLVPDLISRTAGLLSGLNGNNKANVLSQLDNIRQQVMIISGQGDLFRPFSATTRDTSSHITRGDNGKMIIKSNAK